MVGRPIVAVVDDDPSVREALPDLLAELGFDAEVFLSAEAFLASARNPSIRCLILDVAMPGLSGADLQRDLLRRGNKIPIVFITADSSEAVRRALIERGAVACLLKPFSDTALRDALDAALRTP